MIPVAANLIGREPDFHHENPEKTGVLMVNLGTPEQPSSSSLRRYLKEFLSDPRVVEIPSLVWWPILNFIILTIRPKKSAEKYASVWTSEGSPLRVHTENLLTRLSALIIVVYMCFAFFIAHKDWFITSMLFTSEQIFLFGIGLFFLLRGKTV